MCFCCWTTHSASQLYIIIWCCVFAAEQTTRLVNCTLSFDVVFLLLNKRLSCSCVHKCAMSWKMEINWCLPMYDVSTWKQLPNSRWLCQFLLAPHWPKVRRLIVTRWTISEVFSLYASWYAWKPRSALSEGFFLALWPASIRIQSTGGIFEFPQLVYSLRYSSGGCQGCRLPSPIVK